MSIKDNLTISTAKLIRFLLKLTKHKATSLPGKIAYKMDKDILKSLSKNTKFIFITGTNGKTMTTHFVTSILKNHYNKVFTNESGSNMIQGIITSLLDNPKNENTVAVLEVDEANLVRVSEFIKPDYVVLTNIFRDQMDRFGEIYNVYNKILEGFKKCDDVKIIANGDLPIFSYDSLKKYNPIYYGIREDKKDSQLYDLDAEFNSDGILCPNCKSILKYRIINYSSLGDFSCPNCDFHSPKIDYNIENILSMEANYSKFLIDNEEYEIQIGGFYNIYNALAAISLSKELELTYEEIYDGLKNQEHVFGRQENLNIEGKEVIINLVKNPTGLNQIINLMLLEDDPISLFCFLNDNYADGTDVSWIYDSYYERLKKLNIKEVKVSGKRKKDMKRRLEIADIFDGEIIEFDYEKDILKAISTSKTNKIYILSTYTAMLRLREVLNLQ
ncbi:Mur ligase family protein [Anaerococcus sp. AGMB00486]|uniref:Lipid II isoglutaminyl synthase (glutamine-hydrolyzing) subunit MurT n=2 Tax=Anaerococcus TaxID=165779 RepID=A0ABX2N7A8_9FIRM|nr:MULTISPECIES: Mur ligase family protein [Anaerococcus]MDY3007347.1 Mur ligase family protein [Anaerococcus porci]MSS76960.1 Mur ligase family protein [Anaerococcus porci]NVF10555.1 Mur ligase family protein [Anaerococcus faecalis]